MKSVLTKIFPKSITNEYNGYKIAVYVFMLYSLMSLVRSCIHTFSPDGGAGSIAHFDLSKGGENIIFAFALWGSSQLVFALFQVLVSFKYKSFLPLMYILLFLEYALRMFIGFTKTSVFEVGAGTPPGGYLDWVMIFLTVVMFVLTVTEKKM